MTTRTSGTEAAAPAGAQERLVAAVVAPAREQGLALTGPVGLGEQVTKTVRQTALNAELTEHLGHAHTR